MKPWLCRKYRDTTPAKEWVELGHAHRLKNLGIGDWLVPKRYRGEKVAAKLKYLLTDEGVKAATKGVASRFETNGTSPFEVACDVVESLV